MSIGALLVIIGLVVWLATLHDTLGIVLLVVGIVLLVLPNVTSYPRRPWW